MKTITIEWRYFSKKGKTCDRCSATQDNLDIAIQELKEDLVGKGVELKLIKTILPESKIPESNIILIDGSSIEQILPNAANSESECCSCGDLCGQPTNCRTVNQNGQMYEEIPVKLIKSAIIKKLHLT